MPITMAGVLLYTNFMTNIKYQSEGGENAYNHGRCVTIFKASLCQYFCATSTQYFNMMYGFHAQFNFKCLVSICHLIKPFIILFFLTDCLWCDVTNWWLWTTFLKMDPLLCFAVVPFTSPGLTQPKIWFLLKTFACDVQGYCFHFARQ